MNTLANTQRRTAMSWAKREAVTNLVVLGDGEGHVKKVGGLLVGTPHDSMYPDKINYEIVKQDGDVVMLSGSASLGRQINEHDIGKFIKCEFTGWGKSANGKFKVIDVNVWEGPPSDAMKAWPRYAEFSAPKAKPAPAKAAPVAAPVAPDDDFEDFNTATSDVDDDLPF